jgi:hypothetical protein
MMETPAQGENGVASTSFSSLHPPPLDHTNAFLSPSASSNFDVDDFLLSRAPGSTLKEITVDLQEYGLELKSQLNVVVDRDFKGFVSLGAALKAEGPRIARLDWKVATSETSIDEGAVALKRDAGDEVWHHKVDTPRGSGGNLGLDRVRSEVVDVRDQLRKAEEDVRQIIRSKEEAEAQKASLMMLLSFDDFLQRLEALLLPPSEAKQDEDASSDEEVANDQAAKFWQAFSKVKEYEDSDSDLDSSDGEQTSDAKHRQTTAASTTSLGLKRVPSKTHRHSSGLVSARRRSSHGMDNGAERTVSAHANKLNLPARIARASSEHAAFLFLRDRANAMGYSSYVEAHEARWTRVREVLKDDLRKLIATLTRYKGPSLLVGGDDEDEHNPYTRIARAELDSWTLVSKSNEKQREEQTTWFESALQTWCELPPTDVQICKDGASEAEETVRAALTSVWARETITSDALSKRNPEPKTPKTPRTPFRLSSFNWKQEEQVTLETSVPLLTPEIVDYSEDDDHVQALIGLYNEILTFTSIHAGEVCQAAERILVRRSQSKTAPSGGSGGQVQSCDIFVRVVWEEVALRLMEQLGGQLFFAGRPDVFHRNYTISMAFLSAFESLAPSQRARDALHQHTSYTTFRKRWQLPVYFQIRLRDCINRLEKALTSSSGSQFGSSSLEHNQSHNLPVMTATREALVLFSLPWKRGMHIMELVHRQWRLSLQVLARYKNWIEEELPSDIVLSNRRALESSKASAPRSSHEMSRTASPMRTGTPTATDPESDDAILSSFTIIAADLLWLGKEVKESFEKDVAPSLVTKMGSEAVTETLRQTLHESVSTQNKVVPLLSTRITSILKARCAEPLRLVRSVSTQYRAQTSSGTATPSGNTVTEPSSFVVQFLRPVRLYLGKGEGRNESRRSEAHSRLLDRNTRNQWITEVIEDFVARYAASLRTMNKNYESLRRLKRGNAASSALGFGSLFNRGSSTPAAGGKVEETDLEAKRMHSQMETDVEWLEKEVQDLVTVDTDVQTDTAAWKRLKEAARGEQDDG